MNIYTTTFCYYQGTTYDILLCIVYDGVVCVVPFPLEVFLFYLLKFILHVVALYFPVVFTFLHHYSFLFLAVFISNFNTIIPLLYLCYWFLCCVICPIDLSGLLVWEGNNFFMEEGYNRTRRQHIKISSTNWIIVRVLKL